VLDIEDVFSNPQSLFHRWVSELADKKMLRIDRRESYQFETMFGAPCKIQGASLSPTSDRPDSQRGGRNEDTSISPVSNSVLVLI